jgi:hypothetical protein
MLQLYKDIGSIKTGIKGLEGGQGELDQKVSGLHRTIADLVTKDDCRDHRDTICSKIEAVTDEPEEVTGVTESPGTLERVGRKAGAILAVLALLGTLGGGILVLSNFIGSMKRTLDRDRMVQQQVTQKVLQRLDEPPKPVVVHQPVYVYPLDAGVRRRRPRRRPRRRASPRRRATSRPVR